MVTLGVGLLGLRLGLGLSVGVGIRTIIDSASCELNTICHVEKCAFTSKYIVVYIRAAPDKNKKMGTCSATGMSLHLHCIFAHL